MSYHSKNGPEMQDGDLEQQAGTLLESLSFTPKMDGYHYLITALVLVYRDPLRLSRIIKEVYIPVSEKYQVYAYSVERSVRYAIGAAWTGAGQAPMRALFHERPTNSEFIRRLAGRLGS